MEARCRCFRWRPSLRDDNDTRRANRTTDIMMARAKGAAATLERKVFRASRLSKFGTVPALTKQQRALVRRRDLRQFRFRVPRRQM